MNSPITMNFSWWKDKAVYNISEIVRVAIVRVLFLGVMKVS